jgi:DNA (cytosine-5)-methyltransferase 1
MQLHHISLFSGIGGFELAIAPDSLITTIQFVEINPDAQAVLHHHFPEIPIHADIKDFSPKKKGGLYTIGFPCTGTSSAGKKTGLNHIESGLWYEALRCIKEGQPDFIIIENPTGLIYRGLRTVLDGLRMAGYYFEPPEIICADAIGSPQKRARLFIVAYPHDLDQYFKTKKSPTWKQQIREKLKCKNTSRGKTSPGRMSMDDGVPSWLGGKSIDSQWGELPKSIGMRSHTPKRREAISLYARSVCPAQARFAIERVEFLWEEINKDWGKRELVSILRKQEE